MTTTPQTTPVVVSVIMPVLNARVELLQSAVLSVVGQQTTYPCELVIWDDGSHATGRRAIESVISAARILHPRARIVPGRNDVRTGPGLARNAAVEASSGEYLLWLDSDDVLAPGSIQRLVDTARSQDERGDSPEMVISECVVLADDGRIEGPKRSPGRYLDLIQQYAGSADDPLAQVVFAIQAQLLTRGSFHLAGGFSKEYPLAELTEFFQRWVRTHGVHRIRTVAFPAYRYRRRPDSYSAINRDAFLERRHHALEDHVRASGVEAEVLELRGRSERTGAQHYRLAEHGGLHRPSWEDQFGPFTDPDGITIAAPGTGEIPEQVPVTPG